MLRDKIKLKDKRHKTIERHERDVEDGDEEATWEEIVLGELEKEGGPRSEWKVEEGGDWGNGDHSWSEESMRARRRLKYLLWEDLNKAKELGEKMAEVVEKEKNLWRQERRMRKHEKNVARKEKQQARQGAKAGARGENVGAREEW